MNEKQLQYAIRLSELLNFSQAAEELGISQPALSKQILALEKELSCRLFDRASVPMALTAAGEHFVREARALLYRQDKLIRAMREFSTGERGRLDIGVSPFRCLYLMPPLARALREAFPGVEIDLHEAGSEELKKEAAEGKFDFAVVNLPVNESVLDIRELEPDTLVVAAPKVLCDNVFKGGAQEVNFADLAALPFVVVGQNQELRLLFEKLCAEADARPKIAAEVVGLSSAWAMVRAGVGAALLPLQFVQGFSPDETVKLLYLKNSAATRRPVIVTRRGQYLSDAARFAIDFLISPHKKESQSPKP